MKKFWLNLKKQTKQYLTLVRRLNDSTSLKSTLKAVLFSLLSTFLIILLPVLLIVNLFIFTHLITFLSVMLVILVLGWVILYFHFYYALLKQYHPNLKNLNLKRVQIIETAIVGVILLMISITIISFII